ncbi:branched-chain amino acid ABC transporter permease [Rheinheimera riviphila]|uniref:Branched-chain amino acid ABC transporter permease n=1 Tax=Rheinheimera riviphila TaxID=1834037 RepID=A0A437QIW0_9GAMM|nr:AzlC family ABC transporter permease [Rheinheimera riviphila]RVU34487.1 branched-chain amino acid ABC transporter permease [Rheinheimera riviphila]
MDTAGNTSPTTSPWRLGAKDALPLLGGYIPVAISFGLISVQAGFSALESTLISALIYAGASQFLFIAMVASGAPLWLVVLMTLLINARHVVYGPNLAPYLPPSRYWPWLMHGLTDQIFALAHSRLPLLAEKDRLGWYTAAALVAWFSWIAGTALGAVAGAQITQRWPLLGDVMPFALPALFLVLLAPRFTSTVWSLTLVCTISVAMLLKLLGISNGAIPLAALAGVAMFYLLQARVNARIKNGVKAHG